jgi:DNA-binding transcriptional LysR family regulator
MVAPHIVVRSNLIAVLPKRLAENLPHGLPVKVLPLPFVAPKLAISLYWHERHHNEPCHIWLRKFISDHFA